MLSVVINAYPGTDQFRFRLGLETFLYDPGDYFNLCRNELNGWSKQAFNDHPCPKLTYYGFKKAEFDHKRIEMVLALDSTSECEISHIFKSFCEANDLRYKIVTMAEYKPLNIDHKPAPGVALMRNVAIQVSSGDFLVFRDDDDFSCSFRFMLQCCDRLTGPIGIVMTSQRLKNTWGTVDNPFSITPTPIDISTLESVDNPSVTSMCSKIFTRASLKTVYNSTCLVSLEDARSHHLQQLPQKPVMMFGEHQYRRLLTGWRKWKAGGKERDVIQFINRHIGPVSRRSIPYIDYVFDHSCIVEDHPFFVYVFPSGSYSSDSWSWGGVLGCLQAFRDTHRYVPFTMRELIKLRQLITHGIKTKLIDTNCQCKVTWTGPETMGQRLASALESIVNYHYIYWFGVVHKESDWDMFRTKLNEIRECLSLKPRAETDRVRDDLMHPNTKVMVRCNDVIVPCVATCGDYVEGDLIDADYVSTKPQPLIHGGSSERCAWLGFILMTAILIVLIWFIRALKDPCFVEMHDDHVQRVDV